MSYATRIMNGRQLAAVVTSDAGEISISPEANWELETATINVTMRKPRKPRAKRRTAPPSIDKQTAGYLAAIKGEPTP
jgi:hypothetical protein